MTFRYSAINTAYTCYLKYKRIYIDGEKADYESGDVAFGSALHRALHAHFKKQDPELDFDMAWGAQRAKPYLYTRFNWEQLREMGLKFISRWVRLHAKKYEPFKVEENITTRLSGFMFQGTPDYVGLYQGVPSVVDFKTSAKEYDKKKIITNEQMYLYAYMVKEVFNYDVKALAYVVFIKGDEPRIQTNVKIDLDEKLLQRHMDNVKLMCEDLSQRTKFPMNKNSCNFCEFFNKCYEGQNEQK